MAQYSKYVEVHEDHAFLKNKVPTIVELLRKQTFQEKSSGLATTSAGYDRELVRAMLRSVVAKNDLCLELGRAIAP